MADALLLRAGQTARSIQYGCAKLNAEIAAHFAGAGQAPAASEGERSSLPPAASTGNRPNPGPEVIVPATAALGLAVERRVFLSYARGRQSTPFARWCKARLEAEGWTVWFDEEGEHYWTVPTHTRASKRTL